MSLLEWRGGFPVAFGGTVTTAGVFTPDSGRGAAHDFATQGGLQVGANLKFMAEDGRKPYSIYTKWLDVRNLDTTATNGLRVYFSQKSFDDDTDFVEIPGGASQLSVWQGPYEVQELWFRSTAGTPAFRFIAANRRG